MLVSAELRNWIDTWRTLKGNRGGQNNSGRSRQKDFRLKISPRTEALKLLRVTSWSGPSILWRNCDSNKPGYIDARRTLREMYEAVQNFNGLQDTGPKAETTVTLNSCIEREKEAVDGLPMLETAQ